MASFGVKSSTTLASETLSTIETISRDTKARLKPKIVLSLHHGFSIRYLMQSDVFQALYDQGAQLIVLSISDPKNLEKKFHKTGVVFQQIPAEIGEQAERQGHLQRVFRFIRSYTLGRKVKTTDHTLDIALKDAALSKPNLYTRSNLLLLRGLIALTRRSRLLRRALLNLECRLFGADAYLEFLDQHKPDLVVATSLGTFDFDQFVLRAARKRGIQTASVILSWDNTTTRGYPGVEVDHVIAWSNIMKWELEALNDVAPETVSVEGVAHFDDYFRPDPDWDRSEFMRSLGLDPDKKTILIATKSPNCYAQNPNIAKLLAEAIEAGALPHDCQILLRVHPLHYRFQDGKILYEEVLKVYRQLSESHDCLVINEPNITSKTVNYDMADQEILFLCRLLRTSDVLVNFFSTMNIEAAIFDLPMVNVNFDNLTPLYPCERGHRFDIKIDFESDHNQRIVTSGGTKIANTPAEMIKSVRLYLDDPNLDSDGRRKIVEGEIGPNRGTAGVSIGRHLFELATQAVR
jgi:hypothetical protein